LQSQKKEKRRRAKMPKETKILRVELPLPVWEEFHLLFPGIGERTQVLRKVVGIILELAEEKDSFIELLKEEFKERGEGYE